MFRNFREMEEYVLSNGICPVVALANAQDEDALGAVVNAKRKGVIRAALIGDTEKIKELLKEFGEDFSDYVFYAAQNEQDAAALAMELVKKGEAAIPMKGIMQTATFMKAVLNKENGFVPEGHILSQATVLEWPEKEKFLILSDCAVNIEPDLNAKVKIVSNALELAGKLGFERPKVAVLSALETVNPKIQSSVDADELSKMDWDGAEVFGPLALDNAVDIHAAKHKGITHPVAGNADILIMPDLPSGNIFTKSLIFFAHLNQAGTLCGASIPVIMTSRADTVENKYYSILTAVLQGVK